VAARLASLTICTLLISCCGAFTAPKPTAGDFTDIVSTLVRRNITVTDQVSGDDGCSNSALYSNAVRYDVRPAGDTTTYPIYVFGWKSEATYDADKAAFDACEQGYSGSSPGAVSAVEHLPWRAYGPGWPSTLKDAVDAALSAAGGIPAPVQPE
jgi:hypothetical protein